MPDLFEFSTKNLVKILKIDVILPNHSNHSPSFKNPESVVMQIFCLSNVYVLNATSHTSLKSLCLKLTLM